jgi:quercetin dioxygenase-like cupin family protein
MSDERLREPPESRFDTSSHVFDLRAELAALRAESPGPRGHHQKTLLKQGGRTVALFALDASSGLPEHKAAGTVTIQPIEGEVVVTAEGRTHRLGPHHVLALAPNVRHSVTAERPAAFLLQISLAAP